ncbi:MAG: hypothetical protein ACJAZP_003780 [Psychromonas sp.]|jgi:hypothetical protein|uniref:hypothetical protein n=1 Tax=Psychromonas sp. TaxID=1884585 RepID=UPI0039E6826B
MLKFLYAQSVTMTNNFNYLNWSELTGLIKNPPQASSFSLKEIKARCAVIAAHDATDKTKQTVMLHNNFTLLRLDLDDSPFDIAAIKDLLDQVDIKSYIVHTTASHMQDGCSHRYRIYIELVAALSFDIWSLLEKYLCHLFAADDCATRSQQIMYLPSLFPGVIYDCNISEGNALQVDGSLLLDQAMTLNDISMTDCAAVVEVKKKKVLPQYCESLIAGQVSIIDLVNQSYTWDYVLAQYGYEQQGRHYLSPESKSKMAGVHLLEGNDGQLRYYSHHASDPCATGRCLNIFEFIVVREFNGDAKAAVKSLSNLFPEFNKHNLKLYLKHQQQQQIQVAMRVLS